MSYAVIDFETTGFSPQRGDRVVEVGVVLLDDEARVEHEWTTLVNPQRDVGPTHVHGIHARDVADAPTFGDIAGHLVSLLGGRTVVAHNQAFDVRFLRAELSAHKHEIDAAYAALCTMLWSRRSYGAAKLADVCAVLGLPHAVTHAALDDARAAAGVLSSLLRTERENPLWDIETSQAIFPLAPSAPSRAVALGRAIRAAETRWDDATDAPLWQRVSVPTDGADPAAAVYLELLAEVLEDGLISAAEYWRLAAIAEVADLGSHRLPELHARYLDAAIAEAAADGQVTGSEREELARIATLLDLPLPSLPAEKPQIASSPAGTLPAPGDIPAAHRPTAASEASPTGARFQLSPGCRVVFTGAMSRPREEWARAIADAGFITGSVTKNCAVLVAADPASQSGKAKTAAKHGIPIVTESEFEAVFEEYLRARSA